MGQFLPMCESRVTELLSSAGYVFYEDSVWQSIYIVVCVTQTLNELLAVTL